MASSGIGPCNTESSPQKGEEGDSHPDVIDMPSPVTRNMDLATIDNPVRRSRDDADEANHGRDYDP